MTLTLCVSGGDQMGAMHCGGLADLVSFLVVIAFPGVLTVSGGFPDMCLISFAGALLNCIVYFVEFFMEIF